VNIQLNANDQVNIVGVLVQSLELSQIVWVSSEVLELLADLDFKLWLGRHGIVAMEVLYLRQPT
jgi:hypothetical protein